MRKISEASQQVSLGSEQMATSAQSLAEGATEQAGAVQQLTATIENITTITEPNSEEALKSYESSIVETCDLKFSLDCFVAFANTSIPLIISASPSWARFVMILPLSTSSKLLRTANGRKVLAARRAKGRHKLSA